MDLVEKIQTAFEEYAKTLPPQTETTIIASKIFANIIKDLEYFSEQCTLTEEEDNKVVEALIEKLKEI